MKRILVPSDFSVCANNATEYAMEIAKRLDAEIHFLHFTSIPTDWINLSTSDGKMYPDVDKRIKEYMDRLNELVNQAKKRGVKASSYIGYNESYRNIIDHIDRLHVDLVVMGSHGASGLKEVFLGSNAQKVIRLANVPVLVVKENTPNLSTDKMIIVSDFDPANTSNALNGLLKLGELLDLKIHLLFVNTPGNFITSETMDERLEGIIKNGKIASNTTINAFNVEAGIADFLDGDNEAVIGMMTHGNKGLSGLFQGSLVEEVANHIENPLLSVHLN